MKRVRHLLRLLLVGGAVLFPLTVSAQSPGDDQVITSTFDGRTSDVLKYEMKLTGNLLTKGDRIWSFIGGGNPYWPAISSAGLDGETVAKLQLYGGKSFTLTNAFDVTGLVKKIVVRAAGDLEYISLSGGGRNVTLNASVTSELKDYTVELETPWGVTGEESVAIELKPAWDGSGTPVVYLSSITITLEDGVSYGFAFCGTLVTSNNCTDIPVDGMTGTAIYDPTQRALHLENVTFSGNSPSGYRVVTSYDYNAVNSVVLKGENTFTNTNMGFNMGFITFKGLSTDASLTCKGSGEQVNAGTLEVIACSLKFESQSDAAVSANVVRIVDGGSLQCKTLAAETPALQLWTEDITMATGMAVLPEGLTLQEVIAGSTYGYCYENGTPAMEVYIGSPDSYSPSYTSTFTDFTSTGNYQGTLTAVEKTNWTVTSEASSLSGKNNVYYNDDKCIMLEFGDPDNITLTSQFPVTGKVRKVTVTMGGNVNGANVIIGNNQRATNEKSAGEISDFVANFGSGIEVTDAQVVINLTAYSTMFIQSITIETGEGEEQQTTSGTTGPLNWKIEDTGDVVYEYDNQTGQDVQKPAYRLTITGNGYMPDYSHTGYDPNTYRDLTDAPWSDFATITEVVIGEGVISVGSYALIGQSYLESVTLPSTMEIIAPFAFMNASLYNGINLPEGLLQILDYSFAYTSMQSVTIPSTVELVSGSAFRGNNLRTLTVAEGNTTYDSRDNSNAVIVTADNKLYIGTKATFIPATVTSIADYAFQGLYNLKTLVIPEQITTIGKDVFLWANQLTDVTCLAHPANLTWTSSNNDNNNFKGNKDTKLHVRASELETWQSKFANLNVTFADDVVGVPMEITDAKYSTFMAPFSVVLPAGVSAFTVNTATNDQVELTKVNTIDANTPVILYSDNAVNTTAEGVRVDTEDTYTVGLLTGTYKDMTAPEGAYILQKVNGVATFRRVDYASFTPTVAAYHAYLTVPGSGARMIYIGGNATGINVVEALTDGGTTIYDASGMKQPKLKKGLNILTTSSGKSVKVMVK